MPSPERGNCHGSEQARRAAKRGGGLPRLPALADGDADRVRRGRRPREGRAGIDRSSTYVTNAVKHFKWTARGKRRIHAKPSWSEVAACHPWLEAELEAVHPEVLVCLGATAAQALLGRQFRVTKERGTWVDSELAPHVTATIHPSSILRQRTDEDRHRELAGFVEDLKLVASIL